MHFTQYQDEAITHYGGHLQLIACAGSGKTEVVARRIAELLRPGHPTSCEPRHIVAFTFTEKAAAELKERIVSRCRELHGRIHGLAEMYVGTIHAFALELLKSEVPEYLKYQVLNDVQQVLFIDRYSKQSGLTSSQSLDGKPLRRYIDTAIYARALSIIREDTVDWTILAPTSIPDALQKYCKLLNREHFFDYSSMLHIAVEHLSDNRELRKSLASRIRHVIVDEYQDVNPLQENLIGLLRDIGAQVCVVGDDDQTVYQWRGSDFMNIVTFPARYANAKQVRLEENFRSSNGIVESARDFIARNAGARLEKAMKPTGAQADEIGDLVALVLDDPDQEAQYIVETIQSLRGIAIRDGNTERGISWSDMAILLRSMKKTAEPITRALIAAGIPFIIAGMNNLFDTPEAEAARRLFYYLGSHETQTQPIIDEKLLENAWLAADLGITSNDLDKAIAAARNARDCLPAADERHSGAYTLQRQFMEFIETAGVREERIPQNRGEIVFYNLAKFSQIISDYESIYFQLKPSEKYKSFASFLEYGADDVYPEGWQNNPCANPDAVRIMTVHQSKGMQWPAVFIPQVLKNRFPSKRQGGRNAWHLIPKESIVNQARYEGSIEDERRLFYVAMTRSQKFLHITAAPIPESKHYQKVSDFIDDVRTSTWFAFEKQDYSTRRRLPPRAKASIVNVTLSFSDIKYFFVCPYQFKLQVLYGFNAPIEEALGYGKSLHDALAEVHMRAMTGDIASPADAPKLVQRHLHTPYAYTALREKLTAAAEHVLAKYIEDNKPSFRDIEYAEKRVEVNVGDGVSIVGRIDLVRRKDTDEIIIVDLKSNDRTQKENVTEAQLHIYALGYEELTGRRANFVETYDLDLGERKPHPIDDDFVEDVRKKAKAVAEILRLGTLPATPERNKCADCDYRRMCTPGLNVLRNA